MFKSGSLAGALLRQDMTYRQTDTAFYSFKDISDAAHLTMDEDQRASLDWSSHPGVIRIRLVLALKLEQLICADLDKSSEEAI